MKLYKLFILLLQVAPVSTKVRTGLMIWKTSSFCVNFVETRSIWGFYHTNAGKPKLIQLQGNQNFFIALSWKWPVVVDRAKRKTSGKTGPSNPISLFHRGDIVSFARFMLIKSNPVDCLIYEEHDHALQGNENSALCFMIMIADTENKCYCTRYCAWKKKFEILHTRRFVLGLHIFLGALFIETRMFVSIELRARRDAIIGRGKIPGQAGGGGVCGQTYVWEKITLA